MLLSYQTLKWQWKWNFKKKFDGPSSKRVLRTLKVAPRGQWGEGLVRDSLLCALRGEHRLRSLAFGPLFSFSRNYISFDNVHSLSSASVQRTHTVAAQHVTYMCISSIEVAGHLGSVLAFRIQHITNETHSVPPPDFISSQYLGEWPLNNYNFPGLKPEIHLFLLCRVICPVCDIMAGLFSGFPSVRLLFTIFCVTLWVDALGWIRWSHRLFSLSCSFPQEK